MIKSSLLLVSMLELWGDLPHNYSMLTRSKKTFSHELGGGEYWNYEALGEN